MSDAKFRILLVNVRGWTSHAGEPIARIRSIDQKPDLVCVNGTFLNQAIEHIGPDKCGGIAAFALSNISHRVTLVESYENVQAARSKRSCDR